MVIHRLNSYAGLKTYIKTKYNENNTSDKHYEESPYLQRICLKAVATVS